MDTYDNVLLQYASSLSDAFTEYAIWNYYTGSRAVSGFGYDEAGITGFPEAVLLRTHSSHPASGSGSVDHLAFNFIRLDKGGQSVLKTSFNGYNNIEMNTVVTWSYGTSLIFWDKIRLNSNNDGILSTATRTFGALIPVIIKRTGYSYSYNYNITTGTNVTITFTNSNGTSNLGDYLWLDGSGRTASGASRSLIEYSNHNIKTGKERFSGTSYKHHDWNNDFTLFKLASDFQPIQSQNQNAYFKNMNPVTVKNLFEGILDNLGSVDFLDPRYIDQSGNQSNSFFSFSSPYYPRGKYGETSGGVFLNENPSFDPNKPIYAVRAPLTQDIYLSQTGKTHKFYFQNWSTSGASTGQIGSNPDGYDQKAVVFTSGSATVNANLKGTQLSNDVAAFSNNSQRKFVRTKDNWLHQVYESMGRVWLEHSTNNGTTWFLGNNGRPLDNGAAKCPSIDWQYNAVDPNNVNYNAVVVAYQQQSGSTYTIEYAVFKYTNGSYVRQGQSFSGPLYTEPSGGDQYATTNANPNIAWGYAYSFALCFERKSTVGSMQPGIYWRY